MGSRDHGAHAATLTQESEAAIIRPLTRRHPTRVTRHPQLGTVTQDSMKETDSRCKMLSTSIAFEFLKVGTRSLYDPSFSDLYLLFIYLIIQQILLDIYVGPRPQAV